MRSPGRPRKTTVAWRFGAQTTPARRPKRVHPLPHPRTSAERRVYGYVFSCGQRNHYSIDLRRKAIKTIYNNATGFDCGTTVQCDVTVRFSGTTFHPGNFSRNRIAPRNTMIYTLARARVWENDRALWRGRKTRPGRNCVQCVRVFVCIDTETSTRDGELVSI